MCVCAKSINCNSIIGVHVEDSPSGAYPTIEPGEHSFPFHFQIPQRKLPSSFEGKFGFIRYWLKATMDRPWKSNYNSKSAVTILEVVDINETWALVSYSNRVVDVFANFIEGGQFYVVMKVKWTSRH